MTLFNGAAAGMAGGVAPEPAACRDETALDDD